MVKLDIDNLSYSIVQDSIWSELEPCLGIVNACLPVLPPVVSHICPLAVFRWKTWARVGSKTPGSGAGSSFTRQCLRPIDAEAKRLHRLGDDVYPLPSMSFGGEYHADAVAHGPSKVALGHSDLQGNNRTHGNDDFMVMKGWAVHSYSTDSIV